MNQRIKKLTFMGVFLGMCLSLGVSQSLAQEQRTGQREQDQQRPGVPGQQGEYQRDLSQKPFTAENFLKETSQCNMLELQIGQMAAQKSENEQVKEFANKLIQDHGKAHNKLNELAQKQNVTLSKQWDGKHQQTVQKFQTLSGQEFDKEFARFAIRSHAKEINQFQKASQHSKDEELQTWARQQLPTLREHLQKARDVAKAVGLDEATITSLMNEAGAVGAPGAGVEVETGVEKKTDTETKEIQKREIEDRLEKKDQPK